MNYFYENRSCKLKDNIPLSIYSKVNFNFRAHWHTEFELVYVESGSIYISINNDKRMLFKGDMAICTSGDIHYYESTNCSSNILLLVFKPEFFGLPANWPAPHYLASSFFKNNEIDYKILNRIKTLLYQILGEMQKKNISYELFIKASIIELCASIIRYIPKNNLLATSSTKVFSKQKIIQDIIVYIENNFTEDISLQNLADEFNINSFNLSKSFNSITGCNLKTYINSLRVSKAESLISNTKKPLIDIAVECGFNSIRTFNRAYKSIKGYIPSSIR